MTAIGTKDGTPSSTIKNVPFVFQTFKLEIDILVRKAIYGEDIKPLVFKYQSVVNPNCENDVKTTVDQAFREVLYETIVNGAANKQLEQIIQQSIETAEKDACSGSLPLLLLSDMFDSLTLDKCEELFSLVEDRVDIWKRDFFFKHCKNQLLRSCNDLLRRLSRSQNTVFCGRILVFLARFFPLSERSGLNIVSEFNLDNVTIYSTKDDELSYEKDEPMEEGEMREIENNISVDYNLYRKFWSLQEYFRQPFLCYNKVNWKHFTSYSSNVLAAFSSFKLDEMKSSKWKLPTKISNTDEEKPVYFAKYLTSQKLLDLEFSDSNFRRYLLIQFLILFQYLQSSIKFKQETHLLTEEQSKWVKETTDLIYKLLKETPPDGTKFAKNVEHILGREEYWNNWKNDGCPDFKRVGEDLLKNSAKPQRMKQKLGDELRNAAANKKIMIGKAEMNRLWNLCPDNWEACRSQKRDFMPSLETYFDTAIGRSDPIKQAENKEKLINDGQFAWRALRLLSHKSPHFFTQSNQPIVPLPKYLENMVNKLAKELPQNHSHDDHKQEIAASGGDDSDDELLRNNDDAPTESTNNVTEANNEVLDGKEGTSDLVTKELLSLVADELKLNWKALATKLIFQEDEILYFASETTDIAEQGRKMLMVWMEQELENATCTTLRNAIEKAGLPKPKCL